MMAVEDSEFPQFPKNFNAITVKPEKITVNGGEWKAEVIIENQGPNPILFKVKVTNNKRCRVNNCADVIMQNKTVTVSLQGTGVEPKDEDRLIIIYTQYTTPTIVVPNAFLAWQRAKTRDVISKSMTIPFEKEVKC
ncbi:unnamed protein product, partial [Mesorhabditis belari]|uniref:Major sperm protein n=1 Tax=Mesorhabditis belari TaxID=2138241 RepID=A0AAF3ENM7_9BILA